MKMLGMRWVVVSVMVLSGMGCQSMPEGEVVSGELPVVAEVWRSCGFEPANTDSVAIGPGPWGDAVYATSKDGDRVDVLDLYSGVWMGSFGETGEGLEQMRRPNGIAVVSASGHHKLFVGIAVVERDNGRVQLFGTEHASWGGLDHRRVYPPLYRPEMPDEVLEFGKGELVRPYGIASATVGDHLCFFVTDTDCPLDETVKVYAIHDEGDGAIGFDLVHRFGSTDPAWSIGEAESIVVDAERGLVYLSDEDPARKDVVVYTLAGEPAGMRIGGGVIEGDPEGLALLEHEGRSCLLVTDQRPEITVWHVFDRVTGDLLGSFTGSNGIANTDGIAVLQRSKSEGGGWLVAVDDDAEVVAYRLGDLPVFGDGGE